MAFSMLGPLASTTPIGPLVAPSLTFTADKAPSNNGHQLAVTAITGTTVTGASVNSPTVPFTITWYRPTILKGMAPKARNSNQLVANNRNVWKCVIRKGGALVPSESIYSTAVFRGEFDLPAGFEVACPAELAIMLALVNIQFSSTRLEGVFASFTTGVM